MPLDTGPVFLSYSHADERWKDRLVQQLRVLEPEGDFVVWDDRMIAAGSDWFPSRGCLLLLRGAVLVPWRDEEGRIVTLEASSSSLESPLRWGQTAAFATLSQAC